MMQPQKHLKPVEDIKLSGKHVKLRIILVAALLIIAILAGAATLTKLMATDAGWQTITADSSKINCSESFTFQYNFTEDTASLDKKKLTALYSEATSKAYWLFTPNQPAEGFHNIYSINHNINQELAVDPVLYQCFALFDKYNNRNLFLGPVYAEYNNMFQCERDTQAEIYNPRLNREAADYLASVIHFTADPDAIRLELLGNNKVKLVVSPAYQAFAEEYELDKFIDLHWMTNAFIADYLASLLQEGGWNRGYIASADGFTRNLNEGDTTFYLNIYNHVGDQTYPAAAMEYRNPTSIIYYRNYPIMAQDNKFYYMTSDGQVTSSYIDPADGFSKGAIDTLICYSGSVSCSEILMQTAPVYIAETLDTEVLHGLKDQGIESIYTVNQVIRHTQKDLPLHDLFEKRGMKYSSAYVG